MSETWVAAGTSSLCLTLGEVNGSVPVNSMRDVLVSEWARAQGWVSVENGQAYQRPLDEGVTLTIRIDDLGRIQATQSLPPETVSAATREDVLQRHRVLLERTAEPARLALAEVAGYSLIKAMQRAADEIGATRLEEIASVQGYQTRYEVHLKVRVEV